MEATDARPAETSMAFHLTLQPVDEAFSGEAAEEAMHAVIEALNSVGAQLRQ